MRFTRQARPILPNQSPFAFEAVDLELRSPRMKIVVRNERQQWWVKLSWLTDRRRWVIAYALEGMKATSSPTSWPDASRPGDPG